MPRSAAIWDKNTDSVGKKVFYLFFPGNNSIDSQASKFTNNPPIKLTTGEIAYYTRSGVFSIPREALWLGPDHPEVVKSKRG